MADHTYSGSAQKSKNSGRKRKYNSHEEYIEQKRHKDKQRYKQSIFIGKQAERWIKKRTELHFKSEEEFAAALLDR